MSEFSESFHFAKAEPNKLVDALEGAGMKGVVWGPSDTGWVSFVPFEGCPGHAMLTSPRSDFGGRLSKASGKPVLAWMYAEDHEWHAVLWRDGAKVAHYVCDWNGDGMRIEASDKTLDELKKLPMRAGKSAEISEALARKLDQKTMMERQPRAYRFAEALGLPEYQWKSSQYLTMDTMEGEDHEGLQVGEP